MFAALVLYVLLIAGFVLTAWLTNEFFKVFRKKEEEGRFDAVAALIIWCGLFGGYSYFFSSLLH